MIGFLHSEEFKKLETDFPFLRRARDQVFGLKALSVVIIDIETTGLEPAGNEITEVAALRVDKGEISDVFSSLIRLDRPLPPEIKKLTGITEEMLLENGADKGDVLRGLLAFVRETPLIAHNIEFDIPFLNYHLKEGLATSLKNPLICTLQLSRRLLPGLSSHKLANVAEYFKVPVSQAHRAAGDVETTHQVWLKLIELLEKAGVSSLDALLKFAP
jgi:DNA polymerase-3 subunit alpha (Gram-positive type)